MRWLGRMYVDCEQKSIKCGPQCPACDADRSISGRGPAAAARHCPQQDRMAAAADDDGEASCGGGGVVEERRSALAAMSGEEEKLLPQNGEAEAREGEASEDDGAEAIAGPKAKRTSVEDDEDCDADDCGLESRAAAAAALQWHSQSHSRSHRRSRHHSKWCHTPARPRCRCCWHRHCWNLHQCHQR